ncbi:MAG TPA: FKBP-type peptidyl-prolyl cis-trans isomerase [Candidatus Acidoferrum sp.]|nr:FKBP-type peptidyl-prolyl cis-trans isomerase [Candidatus Acidoferrum sp.]
MQKHMAFSSVILLAIAGVCGGAQAQQSSAASSSQAAAPAKPLAKTAEPAKSAAKPAATGPLATDKEKQSYAIGMSIARSLQRQPVEIDPDLVARGLRDQLGGGKTLMTDQEEEETITTLQAQMRQKEEEQIQALAASNLKEGDAFLTANKAKDGIVTTASGLQYKILTPGTGPKPSAEDTVVCNYSAKLLDGTEFDSSYKRGQPITIKVGGVIKGWTEALQLMPVGSKWELYVPPDLAYGDRGKGPIGPNQTLIFDVELLSIQPRITSVQ